MAIYHFTVKVVSRGKGQSAIAKAAYNARERLEDERTGETHDYRRKGGIAFEGIFAPEDAPEWVHDRAELYNQVERAEKRKDAQLLREVEIALPHELTEEQREQLVTDFVRQRFVSRGMVADVAIHEPDPEGDERNHHAHILLTMRELGADGFGAKVREWNGKEQLEKWREEWEHAANRDLERFGHEARIDHRTLKAQGLEREPTAHRGPQVEAMERDGNATERGARCQETDERNRTLTQLKTELSLVESEIRVTALEAYLETVDRGSRAWDDALHNAAIAKEAAERRFVEPEDGLSPPPAREDIAAAIADIRASYAASDGPESFRAALAELGFWLARADTEDVACSQFEHGRAESAGRHAPVFELGEYAAVDTFGRAFTLGWRATGAREAEVAAYLSPLDAAPMPTIAETRAEFCAPSNECIDTDARPAWRDPFEAIERGPGAEQVASVASRTAGRVLDGLAREVEDVLGALADFGGAAPTPEMVHAGVVAREERAEATRADWQRYLADRDYRLAAQRDEEERDRREREENQRQTRTNEYER